MLLPTFSSGQHQMNPKLMKIHEDPSKTKPAHQLKWKCKKALSRRKVVFLQGSVHFHVSWEGNGYKDPGCPAGDGSPWQALKVLHSRGFLLT